MTQVAPGISYPNLIIQVPRRVAPVSNDASNATAGVPVAPAPNVQVNYSRGFGPGVGRAVPPAATSATTGFVNAGVTFVARL